MQKNQIFDTNSASDGSRTTSIRLSRKFYQNKKKIKFGKFNLSSLSLCAVTYRFKKKYRYFDYSILYLRYGDIQAAANASFV